ncbi:MAG TPA: DUF4350 domain-containing protein [Pyrinomonadaceae bacterium]|nr:DUF4350 domain-containing protein [Pyrinomonadaceae bacterium]
MRQRFGIIITILLALGVLVAINSLAYVQEEKRQDSELAPNRSTYNSGSTGTRALYDFLSESGYKVMRWREAPEQLLAESSPKVQTFVLIGRPLVAVEKHEAASLLRWVARGGRLVLIDRRPDEMLLPPAGDWRIHTEFVDYPGLDDDPANAGLMTKGVKPLLPVQPTLLTYNIETVQPSRFLSAIKVFPFDQAAAKKKAAEEESDFETILDEESEAPPPPVVATDEESAARVSPAPVVHLATSQSPLLIDYRHGQGRIILLSDSYMVANNGIALKDNLQLAINLLGAYSGASSTGIIAFDEFHQGRSTTSNAFVSYFAGTPVLAIAGQTVLLVLLILWTRGRRFARPVPLTQVDRRSSLEFVASMAELQQRAHAYDLAIENVYSRTRRVLARYAGVDYNSPRAEIAARVASRSTLTAHQIETLMRQSEEAINGGGISERQSIHLVKRLREVENALGLRMRSREVKQSAQNI